MNMLKTPLPPLFLPAAALALLVTGCFGPDGSDIVDGDDTGTSSETGDGDGDLTTTGDGDGDEPTTGDGDGDETTTGDGDGDETTTGDGDGDGSCSELGCACDPADLDTCDEGLFCDETDMVCASATCGNAVPELGEQCDDGNLDDGDGCDNDCSFTEILAVEAGGNNTCVLIEGGRVRCWGANEFGQLGQGHTEDVGDDELPNEPGDLLLPGAAVQIGIGDEHICALLDDGSVRCWGRDYGGRLGYALGFNNLTNLGDDELVNTLDPLALGGEVVELRAGARHTCGRLANGTMRCWGGGHSGALGYGNQLDVGDDELPEAVGDVPVGIATNHFGTGTVHTCAVTVANEVRCWGMGGAWLGYGDYVWVGAVNTPADAGDVDFWPQGVAQDVDVVQLSAGEQHTCALFETGEVVCWGLSQVGQLGQGNTQGVGANDTPAGQTPIELPSAALALSSGDQHTCALLDNHEVICWGRNQFGQLGYGNTENLGDDETPTNELMLPGPVAQVATGEVHTCALMQDTNEVICWGDNSSGQLGYGNTDTVGDDEAPFELGAVQVF